MQQNIESSAANSPKFVAGGVALKLHKMGVPEHNSRNDVPDSFCTDKSFKSSYNKEDDLKVDSLPIKEGSFEPMRPLQPVWEEEESMDDHSPDFQIQNLKQISLKKISQKVEVHDTEIDKDEAENFVEEFKANNDNENEEAQEVIQAQRIRSRSLKKPSKQSASGHL